MFFAFPAGKIADITVETGGKTMLGVMIDCSRNAVLKPQTVKAFADMIKAMGYDTLMLYTEDTYEVDGHPLFGCMRGKYTKEELRDIDAHCAEIGIELVPCIQTLAHLNGMFAWSEYNDIRDCDDILLAEDEKTYQLIESMIASVSQSFSSKKIHIGMDEFDTYERLARVLSVKADLVLRTRAAYKS